MANRMMLAMERYADPWTITARGKVSYPSIDKDGRQTHRPVVAGGRSLARPTKPSGGGKQKKIHKVWWCIGCDAIPGQACRRWGHRLDRKAA